MPWKATRPMDQRAEFVLKAEQREVPFRQLCEEYGVSPKTGYKWVERFHAGGVTALHDQSTRPRSSPAGLPEDVVCRMVALKSAHPHWGPRKVKVLYERAFGSQDVPSESSFKRVLEKAGLVDKRVARRPANEAGRIQLRRAASEPNEVWTVDFKGWWHAADGRRCEPLTIRDAYSRFVLCAEPLESSTTPAVRARFERAFESYGLPQTIRSDNGPPFASSNGLLGLSGLSVWWLALGIALDRIDPGRPDQNGSHERMHRDIALEVQATGRGDLESQRAALAVWREEYNQCAPTRRLGYRTPAQVYTLHAGALRVRRTSWRIPMASPTARVRRRGTISFDNTRDVPVDGVAGVERGPAGRGNGRTCGRMVRGDAPWRHRPPDRLLHPRELRLWKCRPDGQPVETKSRFHRLPTGLGEPGHKPPVLHSSTASTTRI